MRNEKIQKHKKYLWSIEKLSSIRKKSADQFPLNKGKLFKQLRCLNL